MHKTQFVMLSGVTLFITLTALGVGTAMGQQSTGEQARREMRAPEASYSPVADPKAVVTLGHARFTVLTPELIRMEWAADGKFEDHASFVFLNRKLPVPKFSAVGSIVGRGKQLLLTTDKLRLTYTPNPDTDGKFT